MGSKTIYLASPYGFSEQWKRLLLPEFVAALEALGLEVWEPFERNGQVNLAEHLSCKEVKAEIITHMDSVFGWLVAESKVVKSLALLMISDSMPSKTDFMSMICMPRCFRC